MLQNHTTTSSRDHTEPRNRRYFLSSWVRCSFTWQPRAMEKHTAKRQQVYVGKDMEEMCKLLDTMSKNASAPNLPGELSELMYTLKTQRLRHRKDASAFCRAGGVASLIRLLSVAGEGRELVLLLGTLANVCSLDSNTRNQVMNHGLEHIVKLLKESTSHDTLNTSARCLANLALDSDNITTLQRHGVLQHLTTLLSRDDRTPAGSKCCQSILRCVRILCSSSESRDELKALEGVGVVVECLSNDEEEVALSALQVLGVLAKDGDPDTLRPLCEVRSVQNVIRFCNHIKPTVRSSAIQLLISCTKSSDGRVAMSSAGGVETLVAAMEWTAKDEDMFKAVVCGACVCCREVVSRQRLRDCGGLHKIIKMLSEKKHSGLYHNIMAALVCYYFDETTLKVMVKQLGLLGALKHHLELMVEGREEEEMVEQQTEREAETEEEGESLDADQMATVSSYQGEEEELEGSDVADLHSAAQSSSPASLLSGTSSKPSSSTLTRSSSLPCSTVAVEAELSLRCTHPQQEVPMDQLSYPDEDSSMTGSSTPLTSTKRPKLQLDFELISPMPANFLDSLLSSPNPYQKESKASDSSFIGEQHPSLSSQVILMLSRISHLRDLLTYLSSPEMLPAIFGYFAKVKPSDYHVFKVLTRLFMNPHCFQDCITCLVPSKLYELLRLANSAESELPIVSPLPTFSSPLLTSSGCSFTSMCCSLLERLSRIAESPYGQGVLAHSLLRGDDSEKQASCLSLPLLCRSPRLCQRMMLGYGSFLRLSLLSQTSDDDNLQAMALDSLLQLAHNMIKPSPRKRRHSYSTSEDLLDIMPPKKAPRLSVSSVEPHPADTLSLPPLLLRPMPCSRINKCRYIDHDHCPFDMVITVKNEGSSPLSMQVHKSMLVDLSDVFAVMLGGQYLESSCSEVVLNKLPPLAFLSLIHYAYGCGWQCSSVMERVLESDWLNVAATDDDKELYSSRQERLNLSLTSDLLISRVVDKCVSDSEKRLACHCLQVLSCAGMFLLPELVTLCEHKAVNYLVPDNVSSMFSFAELHWCLCLAESCVRSVVHLPHSQKRTEILRDIVESPQGETALNIIKVFLEQSGEL